MLSWLSDLAYFLASFIPHLVIIRSTHEGVRFRLGVPYHIEGGRLIMYWPIVTQLVILPKIRQTTESAPIYVTTFDDQVIAISVAVVYRISDVFLAVTETWDIYSVIDDVTETTLSSLVSNTTFDDICKDIESFNAIITREIRAALKVYGIDTEYVQTVNFSRCMVLRNIGDVLSRSTSIDETTGLKE